MKGTRGMAIALVLALGSMVVLAGDGPEATDERSLIEQAMRDYIEGWYTGDAERMERALHPDLAKRTLRPLPNGRQVLNTVSASNMVEYTRWGVGTKTRLENPVNRFEILDVSSFTATAKSVTHEFIDYIHLAKIDGRWQIVNVLWEPVPKGDDASQ